MSGKESKILETFEKVLPNLTERERERLLSFGEGMAFAKTAAENTESADKQ